MGQVFVRAFTVRPAGRRNTRPHLIEIVTELSTVCTNRVGRYPLPAGCAYKRDGVPVDPERRLGSFILSRVESRSGGSQWRDYAACYAPTLAVLANGAVRRTSAARPKYNR